MDEDKDINLAWLSMAIAPESLLAVLKQNRIIRKRTDANCSSFHLRVFLGLSNPSDRGRLALYLYRVITLVKEKLSLTWGRVGQLKCNCINTYTYLRF
jgi:hypothetical protein